MIEEIYNKIIEDMKSMTDEEYKQYLKEAEEMDKALEKEVEVLSNNEESYPPINSACYCVLAGTKACETCPNNPSKNRIANVVTTTQGSGYVTTIHYSLDNNSEYCGKEVENDS